LGGRKNRRFGQGASAQKPRGKKGSKRKTRPCFEYLREDHRDSDRQRRAEATSNEKKREKKETTYVGRGEDRNVLQRWEGRAPRGGFAEAREVGTFTATLACNG